MSTRYQPLPRDNFSLSSCIVAFLLVIFLLVLFVTIGGFIVMVLWNLVIPSLGGPAIELWQAIVLTFLIRFLFGGFRVSRSRD